MAPDILHFSDTHLGYQAFDRVDDTSGVNAREADIYAVFEHIIDRAIAERPAVVVHSGDFFHRPSPSNRALTHALEQLRRLSDAQIPIVILAGNHETPRTFYNSPILRALRTLRGVYPIFSEAWETYCFDQIAVHGVPHINDEQALRRELMRMEPLHDHFNLLLLHTSMGKRFLMEEYGEQAFPSDLVERLQPFRYIALGHWHNAQPVGVHPNAWYAGSIERLSDTEVGVEKGFLWITLSSYDAPKIAFEPVPTRPWLKFEIERCRERSVEDILHQLAEFARQHDTSAAILSLLFSDIRPEQNIELTHARLSEVFPDAFQLLIKRRTYTATEEGRLDQLQRFDRLEDIFADFVRHRWKGNPAAVDGLLAKATYYFQRFEQ